MVFLRCHLCNKTSPTPFSVTEIKDDGSVVCYKLCEKCGLGLSEGKVIQPEPKSGIDLTNITTPQELFEFITGITKPASSEEVPPCECGLTGSEFDRTGIFGCEKCYSHFTQKLEELVFPYHQGAKKHVGKQPKAPMAITKEGLQLQLIEAVRLEEYERAQDIKRQLDHWPDSPPTSISDQ